jgi:lipocalin-like protein
MRKPRFGMAKSALLVAALIGSMLSSECPAQPGTGNLKQRMIGSWTLLSAIFEQPGGKRDIYGPGPRGFATFDSNGRFALILLRSSLPKISSNNREAPTPDESKSIATGALAYYGRYAVGDNDATVTFHIEASTFPNWDGIEQKRTITVVGDELQIINPATTAGSGTAYVTWRREK